MMSEGNRVSRQRSIAICVSLVGNGVYRLAERRDHVEAARNDAVRCIADTGEQQHERGSEIIF